MSIRLQGNIWHYNIFNVRAISGIYKYNIVVSFSEKTTFQTIGLVIDVPVYWRPPMAFACPARRVRVGVSILHGHRRRGVIKPCFVVHINIVAFNTGAWSVSPYLYSCGNLYFCKHRTFIIIYGKTLNCINILQRIFQDVYLYTFNYSINIRGMKFLQKFEESDEIISLGINNYYY